MERGVMVTFLVYMEESRACMYGRLECRRTLSQSPIINFEFTRRRGSIFPGLAFELVVGVEVHKEANLEDDKVAMISIEGGGVQEWGMSNSLVSHYQNFKFSCQNDLFRRYYFKV
jgi:hypothetical protein